MGARLGGRIALVAGATRQVGRGVAVALAEAGATVYITSRRLNPGRRTALGNPYWGSLNNTLREVQAVGGTAIAVRCDHADDDQSRSLIERIRSEQGRLDILVNAVWAGYDRGRGAFPQDGPFASDGPFWQQPLPFWDESMVGVRASYAVSALAAPLMVAQGHGLICLVTFLSGRRYMANVAYGVSHAAIDRMAADMAVDLKPHGVAVVALCPMGPVEDRQHGGEEAESGVYIGRCVAALHGDPARLARAGQVLGTRYLGREYGVADADGSQPPILDRLRPWHHPDWPPS